MPDGHWGMVQNSFMGSVKVYIPEKITAVKYVGSRIPGCENQSDLTLGANCQVFAYALLRENGLYVPNDRSSELWADETYSKMVTEFRPLDIMLYNDSSASYGAHVGVYVGNDRVFHLSSENGTPRKESHKDLLRNPKYRYFIGAKRIYEVGA